MEGIFTPWKLANAIKLFFFFQLSELIYQNVADLSGKKLKPEIKTYLLRNLK